MSMHDLIRQLKESNKTKIVMLVADGLGGLPIEPGGKTELETARTPNLDALGDRGDRRPEHAGRPGDHPGLGPGAPRPVRLRPAGERHRPGRAGGAGDRRRGRAEGRRDPGQLLHDRRRGARHRPPGRADPDRGLREARRQAPRRGEDRGGRDPGRAGPRVPPGRPVPGRGAGRQRRRHRPALDRPAHPGAEGGRPRLGEDRQGRRRVPPPGEGDPQGREPGQLPDDARVRQVPRHRHDGGGLRPQARGHRRLPDVPRPGPAGGDDRRRARQDPGRPDGGRQGRTGTNTTSSSSTTSTPTAPARTATSPRRSR